MFKRNLVKALVFIFIFTAAISSNVLAAAESEALKGVAVVDGEMEDAWKEAKVMEATIIQPTSKMENPATAKVRAMWSEKYLYVYAEVTDTKLNKDPAQKPWEVDSIEFFMDENNGKTEKYDSDDSQYRVDFENVRTAGGGGRLVNFKESAVKKTDTGYIVEAALPFKIPVTEGKTIGFDIQVNDDPGSGKREGIVGWSQTQETAFASSAVFGNLVLSNKEASGAAAPTNADAAAGTETKETTANTDANASGTETQQAANTDANAATETKEAAATGEEAKAGDTAAQEAATEPAKTGEAKTEAAVEEKPTDAATAEATDTDAEEKGSSAPMIIGIVAAVVIIAGAAFIIIKKGSSAKAKG